MNNKVVENKINILFRYNENVYKTTKLTLLMYQNYKIVKISQTEFLLFIYRICLIIKKIVLKILTCVFVQSKFSVIDGKSILYVTIKSFYLIDFI